jgi:hypothetical protein
MGVGVSDQGVSAIVVHTLLYLLLSSLTNPASTSLFLYYSKVLPQDRNSTTPASLTDYTCSHSLSHSLSLSHSISTKKPRPNPKVSPLPPQHALSTS